MLGTTIYSAVIIFLVIILLLVAILLVAKAKLVQSGDVTVTINSDRKIVSQAGSSLLNVMAEDKVFLPSACGGQGNCGMCKCQVEEGGGEILPTEVGFFNRKQIKENYRLACQVKVKNDMEVKIPQEVLGIKKWECEVVSNNNVASFIKEFVVKLPEGEILDFKSGSYIQIDVPKYEANFADMDIDEKFRDEWDKFKMWGAWWTPLI